MYPPLIDFGEYHRIESPFYQEDEEFKRLSELEKTKQLSRQENALLWTTNIRTEIELGRESFMTLPIPTQGLQILQMEKAAQLYMNTMQKVFLDTILVKLLQIHGQQVLDSFFLPD